VSQTNGPEDRIRHASAGSHPDDMHRIFYMVIESAIESGPTWEAVAVIGGTIITVLISIVISLVAAYAKSLGRRLDIVEKAQDSLKERMLSQYHDKTETNTILNEVKASVVSLHARFDMMLSQSSSKV
jgi:Tfp pilus assembly protein PilO